MKISDIISESMQVSDDRATPRDPTLDVWSTDDVAEVASIVDQTFSKVSLPPALRRALISWSKTADHYNWRGTLNTIAKALAHRPSIAGKLQGCRSLTQAREFADSALRMPQEFPSF